MNPEQALDYPHAAPPAPGEAQQVAPGVHWLRMPLPYALDHINLWLLEDGDGYAIVDCGIGDGITRELWERIFAGFVGGKPITRVFATHCHPDHMGNAHWLAKVEVHRFDGTANLSRPENPGGVEKDWTLIAVKTTLHF